MRFAIVDEATGEISNLIIADDGDACPTPGSSLIEIPEGLGVSTDWTYCGGEFIPPPPPINPETGRPYDQPVR